MLSSSLIPIRAIKEYRPAKYLVENHEHPYFHMLYMVSGSLLIFCNDISVRVETGDVILFPPYAMHMIYALEESRSIEFKYSCERELQDLTERFQTRNYWLWPTGKKIYSAMAEITAEAENKNLQYLEIISCRIYDVMMQILRHLEEPGRTVIKEEKQTSEQIQMDALDQLSRDAIAYIDEHISEKLMASDLAKQLGYSSAYFSTAFKKSTGISPQQFITLRKVNVAKNLLRKGQMSISAISDLLQFSSVAAFTNTFKKYSGMTPGQFAQSVRDRQYINLTDGYGMPPDDIRSIEPIRNDNFMFRNYSTIP